MHCVGGGAEGVSGSASTSSKRKACAAINAGRTALAPKLPEIVLMQFSSFHDVKNGVGCGGWGNSRASSDFDQTLPGAWSIPARRGWSQQALAAWCFVVH